MSRYLQGFNVVQASCIGPGAIAQDLAGADAGHAQIQNLGVPVIAGRCFQACCCLAVILLIIEYDALAVTFCMLSLEHKRISKGGVASASDASQM